MIGNIWDTHPVVYHYTSQSALASILRGQSLHATHYNFLNDSKEIYELLPEIAKSAKLPIIAALIQLSETNAEIKQMLNENGLQEVAQHQADVVANALYKASYQMGERTSIYEPFIISFCGHTDEYQQQHGQLSQWRSYGHSGGFAIAFDTQKLCSAIKLHTDKYAYMGARMADVVYADQSERIASEFSDFLHPLKEFASRLFLRQFPDSKELVTPFLSCTSRFKHRAFSEENEVRLVLYPVAKWVWDHLREQEPENFKKIEGKIIKKIQFRDNLAPYIDIEMADEAKLPIKYIIVGPDAKRHDRAKQLEKMIKFLELNIAVKVSEIPLV